MALVIDGLWGDNLGNALGARPDFLVLVIVYGSLLLGARPAAVIGFLVGFLAGADEWETMGLSALALSIIGYASAGVWDHLVKVNVLAQCTVLFIATLLHDSIYYMVYFGYRMEIFVRFLATQGALGALYTAVLGAIIYTVARVAGWRAITGGSRR
jgi:rod shape-determining protein MreD